MTRSNRDEAARLLSHLAAAGFIVPTGREPEVRRLAELCLDTLVHTSTAAQMYAPLILAGGIESILGCPYDLMTRRRITTALGAWLDERKVKHGTAKDGARASTPPNPKAERVCPPCDAHAFGQIERAAHVLQMLTAGGIELVQPERSDQLLGMLATSIARRGRHAHGSDYDTASSTLAELEAAKLITIDPARRKRAIAIIGSALAVR